MAGKNPGWSIEVHPRDENPDSQPQRLLDLEFTPDYSKLKVSRLGANGQVQTFEMRYEGLADLSRLFASEALAMVCVEANRNFVAQGLDTSMAAPVSFSPEGHVVCEINRAGKTYRRVTFDPASYKLTIEAENGSVLLSKLFKDETLVTIETAKTLGVKLPLGGLKKRG